MSSQIIMKNFYNLSFYQQSKQGYFANNFGHWKGSEKWSKDEKVPCVSHPFTGIAHLPCSTIIAFPGKMPPFVSLSGTGTCGEEDSYTKARLLAEMAGGLQAKRLDTL
jgi:hypothetical protein